MQNDIARFGGLLCMAFGCLNFEQSKAIIAFRRCMIEYRCVTDPPDQRYVTWVRFCGRIILRRVLLQENDVYKIFGRSRLSGK